MTFMDNNNYMDLTYRTKSDCRWPTFRAALNLLNQLPAGHTRMILETGCQRMKDDWGAGCSTTIFLDYIREVSNGTHLYSVDLSSESVKMASEVASIYPSQFNFHITQMDSVKYLEGFVGVVDLLYLDSFDFPYGELLNFYGGQNNLPAAEAILAGMSEEEIVEKHLSVIGPSQQHCLREMIAGAKLLHDKSVVLIDDNSLPGGGKPRLAKLWLRENGFVNLLDYQQTLWIKR